MDAKLTEGLVFAREPLVSLLESGLDALLRAHWAEVAHDKDDIALNPDWPEYFKTESEGKFVAFSLRRRQELVGYSGFYVLRSMHYRDYVFAMNDVIYLRPEERGVEGWGLVAQAERALKAMGAAKIFYHVKTDAVLGSPSGDSLEAIEDRLDLENRLGMELPEDLFESLADRTLGGVLTALGYRHVENHFAKLLKETV